MQITRYPLAEANTAPANLRRTHRRCCRAHSL